MVETYEEKCEIEDMKQKNRLGVIELEHKCKMERLAVMLEIAKAGGVKND